MLATETPAASANPHRTATGIQCFRTAIAALTKTTAPALASRPTTPSLRLAGPRSGLRMCRTVRRTAGSGPKGQTPESSSPRPTCAGAAPSTASAVDGDDQRDDQDRDDVRDLDHRVDRRAGGVLVRIADGVAGDGRGVGLGALAAVEAVLDQLLRVVPRAAAGGHRD